MFLFFAKVKGIHLDGRNEISRYDDSVLLTTANCKNMRSFR